MADSPRICVFCGSSSGIAPAYATVARQVGEALVRHGVDLVYGGGQVGLMGIVADAVLEAGGKAFGVIPQALATKEIAHHGLTELHVVSGMHERKALMATLSTAFLTLPGGIGTFEEFFEILSWGALGIHRKPIGILNVDGYFDPLNALLDHGITQQFIRPASLHPLIVADDPDSIIRQLLAYIPPPVRRRWIKIEET
ncbi:MAG: TIGR00730 family Rossman fold protein [Isosphaeraceae bacterium]